MGLNLSVEFFAQNDPVLVISRQQLLLGIAGIPDSSFRHETESRTMNDHLYVDFSRSWLADAGTSPFAGVIRFALDSSAEPLG